MADDLAWAALGSRTSYEAENFDVITDTVKLPAGTAAEFDYVDAGDHVVVYPRTPEGDVVVIEEWRQAVERANRGLPAGGVDEGDASPADAAHRELREETGYEADSVRHLVSLEPANGVLDATFHYFLATDCVPAGAQDLDYDESIRVGTVEPDELVAGVRDGTVRDGRSALAVLYVALFAEE